jgi:hypothetical protein
MLDILMTTSSETDLPTRLCFNPDYHSREQCLKVAEAFMVLCPTLRRFSSSVDGGQCRMYPCFARRPDGKVQLEGFDLIDKDSWRDGI